jgi:hypothetical protein
VNRPAIDHEAIDGFLDNLDNVLASGRASRFGLVRCYSSWNSSDLFLGSMQVSRFINPEWLVGIGVDAVVDAG